MKKVIIIVSALFTLLLTGAFHGINKKSEEVETVTAKQSYVNRFPDPMPDVIPDPMAGFRVY